MQYQQTDTDFIVDRTKDDLSIVEKIKIKQMKLHGVLLPSQADGKRLPC